MIETKQVTVWFDSSCPLCRREIALMRRLDRRGAIHFVDAGDPNATCPVDRDAILARFHAEEGGKLLSGAAAFAAMWRAIPLLRPLGLLAGWRPLTPIFEAAYRRFLRVRPRLQRLMR
ncbi:MAG: DUF393 domain-containing protein [Alphaproteobacteria bacterium]|jgi:predicted DCC family thiol-disulfide oxidoreductase YuxK|nr:DUF393 domain-containing protein [Alphaproteobacteria bacterium]MBU1552893.1 DUF393 domain-containing protein [Alphaproteobacteria bacterium]MBU2334569.1 DUF393 domain-containing protein [Alphaproteobacteria bacterium]MBU2388463.1 DUF393 domain-containing protein [Alphaproteobacteria bacterium]|tara:strand:+ start:66 stop:419 length:354 start_codon:yes stop_codon:yes gene_type:complete